MSEGTGRGILVDVTDENTGDDSRTGANVGSDVEVGLETMGLGSAVDVDGTDRTGEQPSTRNAMKQTRT